MNAVTVTVFFGEIVYTTLLTCMIPVDNFQCETCCLHYFYREVQRTDHVVQQPEAQISKTNELVVDHSIQYQTKKKYGHNLFLCCPEL